MIPYRPFWDIDRWFEDEGDFLPAMRAVSVPRVDVYEEGDDVVVKANLPGAKAEDINAEVDKDMLTIEAKTEEKKEEKDKNYYRREISSGYMKRTVALPVDVDEDKAEATFENGVLTIVIPKQKPGKEEPAGKKISIRKK